MSNIQKWMGHKASRLQLWPLSMPFYNTRAIAVCK